MIEFRNVTKKFNELNALSKINLKISKGEIFTIIGPNGSGKTTILRIMAGIDKPTDGEIYFNNKIVDENSLEEVRKKITLVFQKTVLFNTTVHKNVAYGLELRGYSEREIKEKVEEALKIVRLNGFETRLAKKLSGGEQQRVSLARALVLNTDILLLDEPTANLDPKNVSIIEETVSLVNRERGTTIVMATHNMFQAETLANKAALLINGKIAQVGTPQKIFKQPSEYLASFARLENVFTGTSTITDEGTSMIQLDNGVALEAATKRNGNVMLFVRPEDIILSKDHIISSARNIYKGEITRIADFGNKVKLRINAGQEFIVQITKRSFREMQLNLGSKIFLTFKASSVNIL